ncbi:Tfp pilus assembly protein FimT/FimU [Patescibacteria group bacterium]
MKKSIKGFSIIEIMVSITVLVYLTTVSIVNFRDAEKNTQLVLASNLLVSNTRNVQNMVINGSSFNGSPMPSGGYGIHFNNSQYIIFADNDSNKVYDAGEEMITTNLIDVSLTFFQKDNLLFTPPGAEICANDDTCVACDCDIKDMGEGIGEFKITLSHNNTGNIKNIIINQISGRVGIE